MALSRLPSRLWHSCTALSSEMNCFFRGYAPHMPQSTATTVRTPPRTAPPCPAPPHPSNPPPTATPAPPLQSRPIFVEAVVKGASTKLGEEIKPDPAAADPDVTGASRASVPVRQALARVDEAARRMKLKDEVQRRRKRTAPYDARRKYAQELAYGASKTRLYRLAGWLQRKDAREVRLARA